MAKVSDTAENQGDRLTPADAWLLGQSVDEENIQALADRIADKLRSDLPPAMVSRIYTMTGTIARVAALVAADDLKHLACANRWLRTELNRLHDERDG